MFTTQNMNSTGVPTPLQPAALARVARAIARIKARNVH